MSKHTPGPWSWVKNRVGYWDLQDEHGNIIADDGSAGGEYSGWLDIGGPECDGNARLIAAAPDLLDALQSAQMAMLGYTHRNEIIQAALDKTAAAIAKATNQQLSENKP